MKITAERVLDTVVNGAMADLREKVMEIVHRTANAKEGKRTEIGRFVVCGKLENLEDDHPMLMMLVSLLYSEVEALRRDVKKLLKNQKGATNGK